MTSRDNDTGTAQSFPTPTRQHQNRGSLGDYCTPPIADSNSSLRSHLLHTPLAPQRRNQQSSTVNWDVPVTPDLLLPNLPDEEGEGRQTIVLRRRPLRAFRPAQGGMEVFVPIAMPQ